METDWRQFDEKAERRRMQDKQTNKALRRRRQRKSHHIKQNSGRNINTNDNNKSNKNNNANYTFDSNNNNSRGYETVARKYLPLDKDLLAAARVEFSRQLSQGTPKFINFQKGETINPYKSQKTSVVPPVCHNNNNFPPISEPAHSESDGLFEIDPLRPPIVRLTEQSAEGDGRFLKARLRDPKIMKIVRLYLAYMKDQNSTVCVEGMTPTSIKMLLASEGLPTAPEHLQRIFVEVHKEFGLSPADALADISAYRTHMASERTRHLQQLRESTNKFFTN